MVNVIELDGEKINRLKLIHAYFKKENIDFSETDKYYNMPDLEDLILSKYDIKVMDWKHMNNAKEVNRAESEHDIQVRVVNYLKEHKIGHFAVPNGFVHNGSNPLDTAKYINYLYSEGLKKGMFDITILAGNGKVAFLELKTLKGKPSEYQLRWLQWFNDNNYQARICYGYEQAIEFIEEVLTNNNT